MRQANGLVAIKYDMYDALKAKAKHLPQRDAPICTVAFFQEIREGTVMCLTLE